MTKVLGVECEKEFISGIDLRARWNIDRKQLYNIILRSYDSEKGKWLLRPFSPRNYKPVLFYADLPKRFIPGGFPGRYQRPPEYLHSFDEDAIQYLDQYVYLLKSIEAIENATPDLFIKFKPGEGRPNPRKAVTLEAAKSIKKNHPNLTQKQAAARINEWLTENKYEKYSEKHLIRIIKELKFKPGKPGKPPKK